MSQVPHHQAALLTPSSVPAYTELVDVSRYLRDRIRTVP
ncbi:MAG: adenine phosphoribosyltransferase, partial [Pseudomonadota bacterium]